MWAASDDALLAGLATNDADAALAFIRRFQRRVFGLAVSIVGDAALAQDVAQEAFTRAWRNAPAFDPRRGSVASWLLTITRNAAIDATRLRRADPMDPSALVNLELASGDATPADIAAVSDDVRRLRRAVLALPEDQRRAIVLAAICGRTAREIGEREDIPIGTAKTRIRAAMLKLRAAMADEQPEETE